MRADLQQETLSLLFDRVGAVDAEARLSLVRAEPVSGAQRLVGPTVCFGALIFDPCVVQALFHPAHLVHAVRGAPRSGLHVTAAWMG